MAELEKRVECPGLRAMLTDSGKKETVVADCVVLIDEEVSSKKGVSSIPVKTGYRLVKSIKPGFVALATEHLLPDFADALDGYWKEAMNTNEPATHLTKRGDEAAEALLTVTDSRIEQASSPIRGAYNRLRPTAKKHVESAIPRLARLLEKHANCNGQA